MKFKRFYYEFPRRNKKVDEIKMKVFSYINKTSTSRFPELLLIWENLPYSVIYNVRLRIFSFFRQIFIRKRLSGGGSDFSHNKGGVGKIGLGLF